MSELIDNRAQRVRALKDIIKHLHSGAPAEQVKSQLRQIVKQTDAGEIMAMEQELMAEGMPVEEVRSMCDLHSQVTREVLVQISSPNLAPGHPVDTFRRENDALRQTLTKLSAAVAELRALTGNSEVPAATTVGAAGSSDATAPLIQLRQAFNDLMDVEKHYQRKEHALFPFLEKHGIAGPSKVMWAKHDEIRGMLKQLGEAMQRPAGKAGDLAALSSLVLLAAGAVEEMIFKEEKILLPVSLNTLTEDEWAEVWASSPKYGWCLVEPQQGYAPSAAVVREAMNVPAGGALMLPSGNITLEQLTAIFYTLPLDLTFVAADDRVAFFTEGPERIFARSKAIIGRKVQNCHPPRSVNVVDQILSDFRAGRQNVAEFWIDFHGKYVHIRYFAVRDREGKYLGTLELTQDIKPLRELQGERRLLEYGSKAI
ncbi:MAG: DUF438 domain-containing protein [Candidatus Korobacteraceae bacterium]|jgi:DUF438 domain-containing protein